MAAYSSQPLSLSPWPLQVQTPLYTTPTRSAESGRRETLDSESNLNLILASGSVYHREDECGGGWPWPAATPGMATAAAAADRSSAPGARGNPRTQPSGAPAAGRRDETEQVLVAAAARRGARRTAAARSVGVRVGKGRKMEENVRFACGRG
ncbi:Os02g0565700 [Oryza sativa Japonica Group]|uniref:Uncharacterized protein n=2 Tax=Oryza sativa subsp. japonica TaxID=39947 RepID=A0A0P0VKK5_ORYSJ|nr:hypothetical protein [Oryza sativa Japonica Group]BAD17744.1 hypothetical protein [Oryza sativa Japonica Group]BAS79302.1 Os02g0565700 [Oryza sativa Japonica Group]